jgi:putative toxin-antitoxin system antitoxin component (TIGR02293 family)
MPVAKQPKKAPRKKAVRKVVVETLAYGASAGLDFKSTKQLITKLKQGFPVDSFETLRSQMQLSASVLASVTNIAQRTLTRRKKSGRLNTDESERLFRIAALFDRGVEVLGDRETAQSWFKGPKKALGGQTPLEFADTEPGAREVEALLGRLEHGVYS